MAAVSAFWRIVGRVRDFALAAFPSTTLPADSSSGGSRIRSSAAKTAKLSLAWIADHVSLVTTNVRSAAESQVTSYRYSFSTVSPRSIATSSPANPKGPPSTATPRGEVPSIATDPAHNFVHVASDAVGLAAVPSVVDQTSPSPTSGDDHTPPLTATSSSDSTFPPSPSTPRLAFELLQDAHSLPVTDCGGIDQLLSTNNANKGENLPIDGGVEFDEHREAENVKIFDRVRYETTTDSWLGGPLTDGPVREDMEMVDDVELCEVDASERSSSDSESRRVDDPVEDALLISTQPSSPEVVKDASLGLQDMSITHFDPTSNLDQVQDWVLSDLQGDAADTMEEFVDVSTSALVASLDGNPWVELVSPPSAEPVNSMATTIPLVAATLSTKSVDPSTGTETPLGCMDVAHSSVEAFESQDLSPEHTFASSSPANSCSDVAVEVVQPSAVAIHSSDAGEAPPSPGNRFQGIQSLVQRRIAQSTRPSPSSPSSTTTRGKDAFRRAVLQIRPLRNFAEPLRNRPPPPADRETLKKATLQTMQKFSDIVEAERAAVLEMKASLAAIKQANLSVMTSPSASSVSSLPVVLEHDRESGQESSSSTDSNTLDNSVPGIPNVRSLVHKQVQLIAREVSEEPKKVISPPPEEKRKELPAESPSAQLTWSLPPSPSVKGTSNPLPKQSSSASAEISTSAVNRLPSPFSESETISDDSQSASNLPSSRPASPQRRSNSPSSILFQRQLLEIAKEGAGNNNVENISIRSRQGSRRGSVASSNSPSGYSTQEVKSQPVPRPYQAESPQPPPSRVPARIPPRRPSTPTGSGGRGRGYNPNTTNSYPRSGPGYHAQPPPPMSNGYNLAAQAPQRSFSSRQVVPHFASPDESNFSMSMNRNQSRQGPPPRSQTSRNRRPRPPPQFAT